MISGGSISSTRFQSFKVSEFQSGTERPHIVRICLRFTCLLSRLSGGALLSRTVGLAKSQVSSSSCVPIQSAVSENGDIWAYVASSTCIGFCGFEHRGGTRQAYLGRVHSFPWAGTRLATGGRNTARYCIQFRLSEAAGARDPLTRKLSSPRPFKQTDRVYPLKPSGFTLTP
jgi:hypothetical protein